MYVTSLIIEEEAMDLNSSEWDMGGLRGGKGIGECINTLGIDEILRK